MGNSLAFCYQHPYDLDSLPGDLVLQLTNDADDPQVPKAARSFEKGECVEKAYCLPLTESDLDGSYVYPYLFPHKDHRLFPWGWSLMYGRCPLRDGANLSVTPVEENGFFWLVFKAIRPLDEGEPLYVEWAQKLPSIICAAETTLNLRKECTDNDHPLEIHLPEASYSSIVVRESPVHGMGVFANRDIARGELFEAAPCVPIEIEESENSGRLNDYLFDHNHRMYLAQLGASSIYNHSHETNVTHVEGPHSIFTVLWQAERDIEEGEELFHDYGGTWFQDRDAIEK